MDMLIVTTYGKKIKVHVCLYAYFSLFGLETPPLDKVEPNLKKIPHRNGIWGLEANSM